MATKSNPYGDGKHRGVKTIAPPRVKTTIKASDVGRAIGLALNDHYHWRLPGQSNCPTIEGQWEDDNVDIHKHVPVVNDSVIFTAVIKRVLEIAPNIDEKEFCKAVDDAYWEDR